jgi:hypothetical protein
MTEYRQFIFDATNNHDDKPLSYGLLYTYQAGTDIPAPTWSAGDGYGLNNWPFVLDEFGHADIYFDKAVQPYRINVKDANGIQQDNYPVDNVFGLTTVATPITWKIGYWNGADWFNIDTPGTDVAPGPWGPSDPTRWWSNRSNNLNGYGYNRVAFAPEDTVVATIKPEMLQMRWVYDPYDQMGIDVLSTDAFGLYNFTSYESGLLSCRPNLKLSLADTYLLFQPGSAPGSGMYIDFTVLLTNPGSPDVEIPFRFGNGGW